MIPDHLVQRAIINKLVNSSFLNENVVTNIKEDQIQYDQFGFPAIRVSLEDQTPLGDAVGRTKLSRILFNVLVYSEKPNSIEANQRAGEIINTLFDSQIFGADENDNPNYFKMIRIDLIVSGKAIRMSDRIWVKEIFFSSEAHLLALPELVDS